MKKIAIRWLIIFAVLTLLILILSRPYYAFVTKTLSISPLRALLFNDSLKTYNNQINILLLGKSGEGHEGPNLTDTIMVANYNLKNNRLTTVSIPRDIWSATLRDKVNSAYAYGEAKRPGSGGFILAKSEVSSIIGMPIHYAVAIDFDRFKEVVDYLGGVEVDIQRSFTDKKFPIEGKENDDCDDDQEYKCRYQTVTFTRGRMNMDGETALKFVRSRNAEGSEGTDFAREARQQKVLGAVIDKTLNYVKKPNIENYNNIYYLLNNIVKRDIDNQKLAVIFRNILLRRDFTSNKTTLAEDLFTTPPISDKYDYRWVLIPRSGDFNMIHSFIKCELEEEGKCSK